MTKTYCDRCGKESNLFLENRIGIDFKHTTANHSDDPIPNKIFDLCPECLKQLEEFMRGKDK